MDRPLGGRSPAGVAAPTRDLNAAEAIANLRHFTEGMRGPRSFPVEELVLSGDGFAGEAEILDAAQRLGIRRVVRHHRRFDAPLLPGVHTRVYFASDGGSASRCHARGDEQVVLGMTLRAGQRQWAEDVLRSVPGTAVGHVSASWPWVSGTEAPMAGMDVRALLQRTRGVLQAAGIGLQVSGVPSCLLGEHRELAQTPRNRWYVDAEHQGAAALSFLPDVVHLTKRDVCRSCGVTTQCSGAIRGWMEGRPCSALRPFRGGV